MKDISISALAAKKIVTDAMIDVVATTDVMLIGSKC